MQLLPSSSSASRAALGPFKTVKQHCRYWRRSHLVTHSALHRDCQQQQQQQPVQHAADALAATSRAVCAGLVALILATAPPPADAVMALPRGQLPRTAEIALRRSIPAFNPDVKDIQDKLEVCADERDADPCA